MHLFYMKVSRFSSGLQHYSLKTYYLAASRVVSCSKFVQFIYSLPRNNLKYRCVRQSLDQRLCCARARKLLGYGFPGIKKGGGGGGGGWSGEKKEKKYQRCCRRLGKQTAIQTIREESSDRWAGKEEARGRRRSAR